MLPQQPVPTVPSSPGVLLRHLGGVAEAEGGELRVVEAILGAEQGKWLEVSPDQLGKANPPPLHQQPSAEPPQRAYPAPGGAGLAAAPRERPVFAQKRDENLHFLF